MSTDACSELIGFDNAVSADGSDSAVADLKLAMELNQAFVLSTVLRTETPAAEHENHWMLPLEFGKFPAFSGVIG